MLKAVTFPPEFSVIVPALNTLPETAKSTPLLMITLLPGSITRLPMLTVAATVTAEGVPFPLLMHTFVVAELGTVCVLQLEAVFQFPEAPPVQIVAPAALQAVVPVRLNCARTVRAELITTTHVPVPLHAPLQPTNVDPALGVAVSVTLVPCANAAAHVGWQVIPEGKLETDPAPEPDSPTESVNVVTLEPLPISCTVC